MNDEYGDESERVVDDETVRREIDALLELFSDPNKFAQGYIAYDAQDYKTDPCGDDAVRWCLLGALYRICSSRQTNRALNKASQFLFNNDYVPVNDTLGYDAVMRVLKFARIQANQGDER